MTELKTIIPFNIIYYHNIISIIVVVGSSRVAGGVAYE